MQNATPEPIKTTIEVTVDAGWIEFLRFPDIFQPSYCGYWMYGMEYDPALGWLVHEHYEVETLNRVAQREEYPGIVEAWRTGKELPPKWYRLDRAAAVRAWAEGVKSTGEGWYEDGDARAYDSVIQMALLGEHRYG